MSISATDLASMDYVYEGEPFVDVPASSNITLAGMDYVYRGEPFVSMEVAAAGGAVDPFGMMGFYGI